MPRSEYPTGKEEQILRLLIARGESYGLDIVRNSEGLVKRGTVYVTLGRMEEKGFVESRQEQVSTNYIGIPRRLYRITGLGQRALAALELAGAVMGGEPA